MDKIIFLVQGSASDPYIVEFQKKGTELLAFCNCQAGSNGKYCRHRSDILLGKNDSIVSDNQLMIPMVQEWLKGSTLELIQTQLQEAEALVEKAKKAEKKIRAKLSAALHGHY